MKAPFHQWRKRNRYAWLYGRASLWERALVVLVRPLKRLSTWLWRRGPARAIARRNRLNTPWDRSAP